MVKAFATGANTFPNRLGAWHTRPLYIAALGLIRDYLWRRFTHLELGAHFLDLRSLLRHHCRQTLNRPFQFRDPLLLFERLVKHGLGLKRHRVSIGVDEHCAYLLIGIGEHKLGGGGVNPPIEDTGDIGVIRETKDGGGADADKRDFISSTARA